MPPSSSKQVPVALKHVVMPCSMPILAPKDSVRPDTRSPRAVAAPRTMSVTYRVLVTLGDVVHLQVHALQQAVQAAAPTHEPTHAPMAAMGAEMIEPMLPETGRAARGVRAGCQRAQGGIELANKASGWG